MSACRETRAAIARRAADPSVDPPGWSSARDHFVACRACRAAAIDADPTLLFQLLPPIEIEDAEIAEMQGAVATLVRAAEAERRAPRRTAWSGRAAAAAAVVAVALLAGSRSPAPVAIPAAGADFASAEAAAAVTAELAGWPVVDDLDRPGARVYELPAEGLSVVMIVDASLDL